MGIQKARNGDIELAYECDGPADGLPIVLIPGNGGQLGMWQEGLVSALVERGFRVVRMDNRDSGLSTWLRAEDLPKRGPAYTMRELAGDVIAVADAIGADRVHLLGGSLGATIALATAIHHPDRVASLSLYCAAPGSAPWLNRPNLWTARKMLRLMRGASPDAAAEGQRWVDLHHLLGSPAYPVDEAHWRRAGAVAFERGINGAGSIRHSAAYFRAWDLRKKLARVEVPTLVVQGADDPLQSWRAGRATAKAIPGAEFLLLPGVGHDLPRQVWPTVLDRVAAMAGSVLG